LTPGGNQARQAFSFPVVLLHSSWSAVIALPPEVWAAGFYTVLKWASLEALVFMVFGGHILACWVFSAAEVTASNYIKWGVSYRLI